MLSEIWRGEKNSHRENESVEYYFRTGQGLSRVSSHMDAEAEEIPHWQAALEEACDGDDEPSDGIDLDDEMDHDDDEEEEEDESYHPLDENESRAPLQSSRAPSKRPQRQQPPKKNPAVPKTPTSARPGKKRQRPPKPVLFQPGFASKWAFKH